MKKMRREKKLYMENQDMFQKLNFNCDSKRDPSDRYDTSQLIKHQNFNDNMVSFDKTSVQFLQKQSFKYHLHLPNIFILFH